MKNVPSDRLGGKKNRLVTVHTLLKKKKEKEKVDPRAICPNSCRVTPREDSVTLLHCILSITVVLTANVTRQGAFMLNFIILQGFAS